MSQAFGRTCQPRRHTAAAGSPLSRRFDPKSMLRALRTRLQMSAKLLGRQLAGRRSPFCHCTSLPSGAQPRHLKCRSRAGTHDDGNGIDGQSACQRPVEESLWIEEVQKCKQAEAALQAWHSERLSCVGGDLASVCPVV